MIRVTDSAAVQLRELLKERDEAGAGLRLMVEKGGCAGMQYAMKISGATPGDEVVEKDGVFFFVDAASAPFLKDCEVDYVDTLADRGFRIHNPNAARSCGCGTSFEPAPGGPETPGSPAPPVQDAGGRDEAA
jgi:iron-sulfur cluster assembly accessory protein